jgi:hypothetical protein
MSGLLNQLQGRLKGLLTPSQPFQEALRREEGRGAELGEAQHKGVQGEEVQGEEVQGEELGLALRALLDQGAEVSPEVSPESPEVSPESPEVGPESLHVARSATILLSSGSLNVSLRASAWEIMCVTFKLAKVFPHERCHELSEEGGSLTLLELQYIKTHIEEVLLKSMERGDYLFSDLSLSDLPPTEAFREGDARRTHYLDRESLTLITSLAREARSTVTVRRLQWRSARTLVPIGDVEVERRTERSARSHT